MLSATCRPSGLAARSSNSGSRARKSVLVRADNRPLREFNEDTGKVSAGGAASSDGEAADKPPPKFLYADENPEPPRPDVMSKEMKEKLRKEYLGLGGSANTKMGSNYFLNIILVISFLAVLSKLFGYI